MGLGPQTGRESLPDLKLGVKNGEADEVELSEEGIQDGHKRPAEGLDPMLKDEQDDTLVVEEEAENADNTAGDSPSNEDDSMLPTEQGLLQML